jgi:hypothetical protein
MKLRELILEAWDKDQKIPDKRFTTYFISYIVKFKKALNKNEVTERIRGIKNVTIVEIHKPAQMVAWSKKSKDYEYNLVDIKFNTNLPASEEVENIKFAMLKSDEDRDIKFIEGIVAVKPLYDTLLQLDTKGVSKRLKIKSVD